VFGIFAARDEQFYDTIIVDVGFSKEAEADIN
jgi:hypothetical protein